MPLLSEMLNSKKTVFIGSNPENDIVLNDAQTSPVHCRISKIKNGVYLVEDLDSASGTFINHEKITKGYASDDDTIRVGATAFNLTGEMAGSAATVQPRSPDLRSERADTKSTATVSAPAVQFFAGGNSPAAKESITVYFLAAPEDEETCKAVYKHLSTIRFSSPMPVEIRGDFRMTGGEDISAYRQHIADADIVLAFVSVDFLNNDNCYQWLKTVIENHNKRKAILLPILVRNCMWRNTPFANLPLLPKNHQPLNNKQYWNSEDDAMTNVADDICQAIGSFTRNASAHTPLAFAETPALNANWRKDYLWKNFWKRTAAYLLDIVIIALPLALVFSIVFGNSYESASGIRPGWMYFTGNLFLILVGAYFDSSKWHGTPGKHILNLQITDDAGNPISFQKALVRNIFKYFLFYFLSSVGGSIVILLIMLGQVGCYAVSKKFIHDCLSHTVIGERLRTMPRPVVGSNQTIR